MYIIKLISRWKEVLLITLTARVLLLTLSYFVNLSNPDNILYYWFRWDGPHYIGIAKNWYQNQGEGALWIVFYPLYPMFIKLFNLTTLDYKSASIITSIFFSFTTSIFLFELVKSHYNKYTAILSVWFLNIFPTSYFLQASYSESVFLTFTLGSLYFFRKSKYLLAAIFCAISTSGRINGVFLIPTLFFTSNILQHIKSKDYSKTTQILLVLITASLGFIFYLLINFSIFGDPFYFRTPLNNNWHKFFAYPWVGLNNLTNSIPDISDGLFYAWIGEAIAFIFGVIITIFTFIKINKSYALYCLLNLILFASTNFIMSTPRYILILFPIYIALALIKSRVLQLLLSFISISLLIYLSSMYTKGQWAY